MTMLGLKRLENHGEIDTSNIQEKRAAISQGIRDSALIRNCLYLAQRDGLNGEDTHTLLAYHALVALEDCNEMNSILLAERKVSS